MAVGEVVAGLKLVSDGVKAIAGIADATQNAEVKKVTIDMGNHVLSLQTQLLDLVNENAALKLENVDLKARLELKGKVIHKPPFFCLDGEDKPLCPKCWQEYGRATYLIDKPWSGGLRYDCPVCEFEDVPKSNSAGRVARVRRF